MKSDARVRYTKTVIKNSFITLLKNKPLNKVTVKDICTLAEINRATFYNHYADCYDLLSKIEDELISELKELVTNSLVKDDLNVFTKIFNSIKQNSDLYITITSENGDNTFPNKILNLCYDEIYPSFKTELNFPEHELEWVYYFSASGCSGVLNHWIQGGMKEDPTELSAFICKFLKKIDLK